MEASESVIFEAQFKNLFYGKVITFLRYSLPAKVVTSWWVLAHEVEHVFECEMLFAIWYHLYNLKNMKNTHVGLLLKVYKFKNCTNDTKSRNVHVSFEPQIIWL